MCGKLKTIRVETRTGSGTNVYIYKTTQWPRVVEVDKDTYIQDTLDDFHSQHTLSQIMRGSLNLCSMNQENRQIWKVIFDNIEEEVNP